MAAAGVSAAVSTPHVAATEVTATAEASAAEMPPAAEATSAHVPAAAVSAATTTMAPAPAPAMSKGIGESLLAHQNDRHRRHSQKSQTAAHTRPLFQIRT